MAVTLFKLAISAESTTTVTTEPTVLNYFYTLDPAHIDAGTLTIPANAFVDDQGDTVTTITLADADTGYYLLFINGVLQQEGLYSVTANNVVIQDADTIKEDSPITLSVINFTSDADTQTTVTT